MVLPHHSHTRTILDIVFLISALLCVVIISAQPSFESFATDETGGDGDTHLNAKPSGLEIGDLLLALACYESGSSQSISSPDGWTLIEKTDEGSNIGIASFFKIADAADLSSSTFTFELSEDKKWTLAVARISGAHDTNPIDIHSSRTGPDGNAKTWSVTTTEDSCLVVAVYGNKKDATYIGSYNEEYEIEHESGQIASQMLETFIKENAGATGNTIAQPTNKDSYAAQQIAIRKSDVTLLDNFRSMASGFFHNHNIWERERSDGSWLIPSDIMPMSHATIIIKSSHVVTAMDELLLSGAHVTIKSGGSLNIENP